MGHGFAHRFDPLTICSYEVDVEDVVDLSTDAGCSAEQVDMTWLMASLEPGLLTVSGPRCLEPRIEALSPLRTVLDCGVSKRHQSDGLREQGCRMRVRSMGEGCRPV